MTQSTPERKPCGTCGEEYTVTAVGGMRHHFTENPDFQATPDSRKCKGVGQPPAGAEAPGDSAGDPQCRLCKHPAQLTGNGRVRSHLTPEATPRPCPAGSDFPLGVYPDIIGTTDGLVATLARDCGHVPVGQCYICYTEAGNPVSESEVDAMAEAEGTGKAPWSTDQPTMADQLKAAGDAPLSLDAAALASRAGDAAEIQAMYPQDDDTPEASRFTELLERETRGAGTVLDRIDPAVFQDHRTPEQRAETAALGVPLDPALNHKHLDESGMEWVHDGSRDGCPAPECETWRRIHPDGNYCRECDTDNHRCPGCGTDVRHGTVACTDCDRRVMANKLPPGETEDGRPCHHDAALFGVENDRLVCVACGTPCTHPDGFPYVGMDEDGADVNACPLCGTSDGDAATEHDEATCAQCQDDPDYCPSSDYNTGAQVGPDPELPNCPHPETHRAGCGCPDDDSPKEQQDPGLLCEQVRIGDLDEGDIFIRRGTRMRLTERESATVVLAEVLDGPHKGRTGELKNPNEIVERDRVSRDPHAREADAAIAAVEAERAEEDRQYNEVISQALADQRVKAEDGWRTSADGLALMSEEIRGMDALRFNCAECNHPITPLIDQFSFDGRAAVVRWVCEPAVQVGKLSCSREEHECRPDCLVNVGDLEFGDHFVRRGVLMRCTSSGYGVVEAVVVEGPHKGRTGELKNPAEQVERTYCRHSFSEPDGDGGLCCEYCGDLKTTTEQETTECTDDRTATQPPRSSAAEQAGPGTTGPGPAPGSKPPTKASAPGASPRSTSGTSSVPTAKASTNGRSAAVTTDQSAAAAAFLGNSRPAAPVTNGSDASAAAAQFLAGGSGAHGEKETKRDRFGRYLIPHPDTGKETAWTRSTTFAKSISDTYALSQWGLRMALLGATVRPDIVQRAHGKHVTADKALLNELTAELKNAAGDKVAANLGTSMHSFTELADRAWHSPGGPFSVLDQVPPDCQPLVGAYIQLLKETGLEPVPHLIEFTTVVKQYGVAGTSDNCYKVTKPLKLKIGRAEVHLSPGEYVIGDKKTGKDLDYGWQEIVIQLATYAQGINTAGVWDRANEMWEPDPLSRFDKPGTKVRLDAGIVVHLPVDRESEKTPAVYGVDLESGWNAAVLCERVRAWRKVRSLASPVMVSEAPETFALARPDAVVKAAPVVGNHDPDTGITDRPAVVTQTTVRPPSLMDKARTVTSKSDASAVWQEAKQAGKSDAEVDQLVTVMQDRLRKLAEPGG